MGGNSNGWWQRNKRSKRVKSHQDFSYNKPEVLKYPSAYKSGLSWQAGFEYFVNAESPLFSFFSSLKSLFSIKPFLLWKFKINSPDVLFSYPWETHQKSGFIKKEGIWPAELLN